MPCKEEKGVYTCKIELGSWMHIDENLHFDFYKDNDSLEIIDEDIGYKILKNKAERKSVSYSTGTYVTLVYTLSFERFQ